MTPHKNGRMILGVIAGYGVNATLIGITEAIYVKLLPARWYFVVDLATQICATIIAGCLCSFIVQRGKRIAATSLTILGLVIGLASLVVTWNAEPHWYGVALLFVYPPCVWVGCALVPMKAK